MKNRNANVKSDLSAPGRALVHSMSAAFRCHLRDLTATLSWSLDTDRPPIRQWVEVSLFRDRWSADDDAAVRRLQIQPGVTVGTLPLETDSVYYWRVRLEWAQGSCTSRIQQIVTPNCVADFIATP